MNTTFNEISTLEFEEADLAVSRQARKSCSEQMINIEIAYTKTSYLPNFYDKFKRLNDQLNQADTSLGRTAQKAAIDLDFQSLSLNGFLKELAHNIDEEEREEILEDLKKTLNEATRITGKETAALKNILVALSEPFSRDTVQGYLSTFAIDQENLSKDIALTEEKLAEVEQQRSVLTAAIDALQSKGLGAIANDTILNVEKIVALGATPPQVAVISLALDILKQSLENADRSLNFLNLVNLRDEVRKRSDALMELISTKRAEAAQLKHRMTLINSMVKFDDNLQVYTGEFRKVVVALQDFLDRYKHPASSDEETAQDFIANARMLSAYLRPIQ
ncbi:MAG TPA: alpha-xenorhabdolysin family binary toxin subunit B [Pseudomonas sp.]|jgi:hypothetical protein